MVYFRGVCHLQATTTGTGNAHGGVEEEEEGNTGVTLNWTALAWRIFYTDSAK